MARLTIEKYCAEAWKVAKKSLADSADPKWTEKIFEHACIDKLFLEEQMTKPAGTMCLRQTRDDEFILNPNKKAGENEKFLYQPIPAAIVCLLKLARAEKWIAFKDAGPADSSKAVDLPNDATPTAAKSDDAKSVDAIPAALPADATPTADAPKAVSLPTDATSAADAPKASELPTDVTLVSLPAETTPTSNVPSTMADAPSVLAGWLGTASIIVGTAPMRVGMSVNGQEPLNFNRAYVYWGAAIGLVSPEIALWGALAGRMQLNAIFEYIGFNPEQDQPYSKGFSVLDAGPKLSLLGVYPAEKDTNVFFGPYAGFLMGGLTTDGVIEVAKGKGYDTDGKASFITSILYGLTVGAEQLPAKDKRAMGFVHVDAGIRQFFWGENPESSNFKATMQIDGAGFSGMFNLGVKLK